MILFIGALLGLISVALGAYANHGLQGHITPEKFEIIQTALKYNQVNAVIISAIGLCVLSDSKWAKYASLRWSGAAFIVGTALFSFSIYLSVVLNIPRLTTLTPIGGVCIMLAWGLLAYSGLKAAYSK